MEEEHFKISKNLLKALTADTRIKILKALENRPMTASELSRFLGKHVTTITEHLDLMRESNLVERIERPGRKWVYYKLTKEGKKVLHPESYRWIMVFSVITFLIVGTWFVWTVDAYPGDIFYGVKRAREKFQLFFVFNSLERAKKHLEFAENRLEEAKVAAEKGDIKTAKELIKEFSIEVSQAKKEIERMRRNKQRVAKALETFSEVTPKYIMILRNIGVKNPALKIEIKPALNASIESQENASKELQKITGRAYPLIKISTP